MMAIVVVMAMVVAFVVLLVDAILVIRFPI
jgi:hypothetical protein